MMSGEQPAFSKANMNGSKHQQWRCCDTCRGNATVPRRLSRKGKRKKLETELRRPPRIVYDPCHTCDGTGLVPGIGTATSDLRIAIIGGGIGGLALAAACCHRGMRNVSVYERDQTFHERQQGYGLTMQQAAPQLRALGIPLPLHGGITSTKHIVHAADGSVCGQWGRRHWLGTEDANHKEPLSNPPTKPNKRQNIHVPRQTLRQELLNAAYAMNPSIVKWDHRIVSFQDRPNGVECRFVIGSSNAIIDQEFDLLVGADGIRSVVRSQLIGDKTTPLRYLGCIVILGICPINVIPLKVSSPFDPLLDGETVFQTADGTTRIYMMPFSTTEYMWQLSFPLDESTAKRLSKQGPYALKSEAKQRCFGWHSPVPQVLASTPTNLVSGYPVYDRAILSPEHLPATYPRHVTLLGDAAHPMSPFKGQGANQALLDALSLARQLHSSEEIVTALVAFEQEMIRRSSVKVQASAEAANFLHTEVAIQHGDVTRGAAAKKVT